MRSGIVMMCLLVGCDASISLSGDAGVCKKANTNSGGDNDPQFSNTPCGQGEQVFGADGGTLPVSGFSGEPDGGGFVDPADCESDCSNAAIFGCNADITIAEAECLTLCESSPTEDQLTCVSDAPCKTLLAALGGHGTLCGIAIQPDDGGADSSTSPSH